jgi:translocation and assembly module TamA
MPRTPLAHLPRMFCCALLLLAAAPLRAGIRVDIDGVEGDLKRNVLAYLSVERYKERDKLEEDTVVRLYNRIDDEVRSALKPLGYYEPKVETTYESSRNDSDWRIRITIEPGKPVIVESAELVIEGPGATDPAFSAVRELSALRKGLRLNHGSYEQAKGDLQRSHTAPTSASS